MSNDFRAEYRAAREAIIKEDVHIQGGLKAAKGATLAMVFSRALLFVATIIASITSQLAFGALDIVMLLISLIFAKIIHDGLRLLAILALAGGFYSGFMAWQNNIFDLVFGYRDIFLVAYVGIFILAIILTIIPMAYLLLNPKYKKYADAMTKLRQSVTIRR